MATDADLLSRLERWYQGHCDGEWEHGEGVDIGTLDNPGWRVRISIEDTSLVSRPFDRIKVERTDEDWVHAWLENGAWNAAGGPLNLREMLTIFLVWADA
jgi:hypothetical protein